MGLQFVYVYLLCRHLRGTLNFNGNRGWRRDNKVGSLELTTPLYLFTSQLSRIEV